MKFWLPRRHSNLPLIFRGWSRLLWWTRRSATPPPAETQGEKTESGVSFPKKNEIKEFLKKNHKQVAAPETIGAVSLWSSVKNARANPSGETLENYQWLKGTNFKSVGLDAWDCAAEKTKYKIKTLKRTQRDVSDFPIPTLCWRRRGRDGLKSEGNRQTLLTICLHQIRILNCKPRWR